ncbi:hypothetical protein COY90_04160 [Candidatus Roizmanbacteria bacterium CG_4_10_14_0_8_um_filter_39_9]|uniref:Type II secretion system protein GspG C-terminal domain-containing protein n=1 Tax=Candidatus Roizmanbacteria bacterium CG_4_10_14_0_8_um_filter_39_9 TaxID=1974829 RepID=A0A2M7QC44_9BACT|nr:MAG: hypothetical protein COY90_04160 [Candidatus Roizmanbacteria bacterium CG_4_10_14_0_8_um_filter_39_9]
MKNTKFGFTLIELLIVIALLGALAVGLLAALDPFEQFKKGDDTGVRNTVSEIQGAIIRYYSVKNQMPWGTADLVMTDASSGFSSTINIQNVIDAGELKKDFSTLAGNKLTNITVMGTSEGVTVCFKPLSKSFRSDNNTKYVDTGTTFSSVVNNVANCGNPADATFSCFWCIY